MSSDSKGKGLHYGIIILLLAGVVLASSLAAVYYFDYTQAESNYMKSVTAQKNLQSSLNNLSSNYTELLRYYNTSLYYLASVISQMNTSNAAYINASSQLSILWHAYETLAGRQFSIPKANILIEYGNGSKVWYNLTYQPGWNLYLATLVALNGSVSAVWYPQYGAHFVTGLGGVYSSQNSAWFLWVYNETWQMASLGADEIQVSPGSSYAWTLCTYNPQTYQPNCSP